MRKLMYNTCPSCGQDSGNRTRFSRKKCERCGYAFPLSQVCPSPEQLDVAKQDYYGLDPGRFRILKERTSPAIFARQFWLADLDASG